MTPEDRDEIKRHFDAVAEGLRSDIRLVADGVAMNTERLERLEGRFETFRGEMYGFRDEMYGFRDEMYGFRDEVHAFRDEMYGFRDEMCAFRAETRENFVELRSMIKLSYAELDRRLATLEDGYGDLKARMERVEARLSS